MNDELQVIDLQVGEGKAAVKGALITTQYTGWLEDGSEFDSSYSRGKPFQCVIGTGRVIKGWDQGLMGMQVGASANCWCRRIWGTANGRWARFRRIRIWCLRLSCWKC